MRGFAVALVLVSACDALRLDGVIGRRSAVSLGALAAGLRLPASAFDLPILEDFDDPKARKKAAAMPNPPIGKQQSSAFYAVSTGDMTSLQLMVDNGWALGQAKDTAGKTVLHRAAQVGNAPAVEVLLKQGSAVDAVTQWQETRAARPRTRTTRAPRRPGAPALAADRASPLPARAPRSASHGRSQRTAGVREAAGGGRCRPVQEDVRRRHGPRPRREVPHEGRRRVPQQQVRVERAWSLRCGGGLYDDSSRCRPDRVARPAVQRPA
jgi:hypothetical protein